MAFHLINGRLYEERDDAFHPVNDLQAVPVADYAPPDPFRSDHSGDNAIKRHFQDRSGDVEFDDLPPGFDGKSENDHPFATNFGQRPPQFQPNPMPATGFGKLTGAPRLPVDPASSPFFPTVAVDGRDAPFAINPATIGEKILPKMPGPIKTMGFARLIADAPRRSSPSAGPEGRRGFVDQRASEINELLSPGQGSSPLSSDMLSMTRRPDPKRLPSTVPKTPAPTGKAPSVEDIMEKYMADVRRAESSNGTLPDNPGSSAQGDFQFMRGTWPEYYRQVFGETGETKAEILAKRDDVAVSNHVMRQFTRKNAEALKRNKKEITPVNLYLAHHFGVTGALRILNAIEARPNTPVNKILSSGAIARNPEVVKFKATGKFRSAVELKQWATDFLAGPQPSKPMFRPKPPFPWVGIAY